MFERDMEYTNRAKTYYALYYEFQNLKHALDPLIPTLVLFFQHCCKMAAKVDVCEFSRIHLSTVVFYHASMIVLRS